LQDKRKKILIYGYGNPGRQDDGLGNAFVAEIEKWLLQNNITGVTLDSNYQLNIEDAVQLAECDIAVYVDASTEAIDDYVLTEVLPSDKVEFTMHAVNPAFVLSLCQDLYGKHPPTYLLHIKGYEWAMQEGLSVQAVDNLNKALAFMQDLLKAPDTFSRISELCSTVAEDTSN
jgi:hydrogenase maturation protease